MRFSGWSSLAISVSSLGGALLFAAPAGAHLSINPDTVHTGALVDLVFSVPNAADPTGIDQVTIAAPAAFVLDDGEAVAGWTQSRSGQTLTWKGGNIPLRQYGRFGIRGTAPLQAGTVLFNMLVADRTGSSTHLPRRHPGGRPRPARQRGALARQSSTDRCVDRGGARSGGDVRRPVRLAATAAPVS